MTLSGPAKDLFNGPITFTVNCNLDANCQGPCWGTFQWDIPALNAKWEGSWNGSFDLHAFASTMSAVGHGGGGQINGLQMKFEGASTGPER